MIREMNGSDPMQERAWPKRYTMMTLLVIALLLCYIDRVLISIAGIEMQREFGWSDSDKGLVFSSFFVGYLCMQILGGILANRFGGWIVFLLAVLGWSVITIITPAAAYAGFGILILARFLLGFGEGAAYPSAYSLINAWMPGREISRSVSMIGAAAAVGTVLALLVVGKIVESYGWPSVFYMFGSLGLIWCAIWVPLISRHPPSPAPDPEQPSRKKKGPIPWKAMFTSPAVLPVYGAAIAYGVVSYTLASWLPSYFVDRFELGLAQAGYYSVLPWVVFALAAVWAGTVADRWILRGRERLKVRKSLVATGFLITAFGCLSLTLVPHPLIATLSAGCIFAGLGISTPGYIPLPAEIFPRHGDVLYGFMAASASVFSIVVVGLTGVLLDQTGSYNLLWVLLAVLCILGIAVFFRYASVTPVLAEDRKG